jgi:hypothetical protein
VKRGSTKSVRCAIYTRVSTDHGLEQDFNSLDAQYDAAQAYIRRHRRPQRPIDGDSLGGHGFHPDRPGRSGEVNGRVPGNFPWRTERFDALAP